MTKEEYSDFVKKHTEFEQMCERVVEKFKVLDKDYQYLYYFDVDTDGSAICRGYNNYGEEVFLRLEMEYLFMTDEELDELVSERLAEEKKK